MPNRLAYDLAIALGQARLKVPDPQLKYGSVAMIHLATTLGEVERPWGQEGAFAIVYKFFTQRGEPRALRCFKAAVTRDMQKRYELLGTYFQTTVPEITTRFTYYNQGIEVEEQGQAGSRTYPLIDMDWIEGETLLDRVDTLCRLRDQAGLAWLSEQWLALVRKLHDAHIAHGDLAGGNVMLRKEDGKLVLVDYDGAFIPTPAFKRLSPLVQGQPDYQHPQMQRRRFDEQMDAFSALCIYTALLALRVEPRLWDTYMDRTASGQLSDRNLLFTQDDFANPAQSAVLRELEGFSDPQVQTAVRELKRACDQPIDEVRWSLPLIDPDYEKKQAFALLSEAISKGDETGVLAQWTPLLENYPPAQSYAHLVERSRKRLEMRRRFQTALERRDAREIIAAYDDLLRAADQSAAAEPPFAPDALPGLTAAEHSTLDLARRFLAMYQNVLAAIQVNGVGDDAQIRAAYDKELAERFADFTSEQRLRIARACDLFQVEKALKDGHFRRALELALAFEQTHRMPTSDFRVSLAKQRFIRHYDLTHLEVALHGSKLTARWRWPEEKHVQYALLCWRPDRWPEHPRKQEPGTQGFWVSRRSYQHPHGITVPLNQSGQRWQQAYVRVYAAVRDEWADWYPSAWYYSEGYEPTARVLAHPPASHSTIQAYAPWKGASNGSVR